MAQKRKRQSAKSESKDTKAETPAETNGIENKVSDANGETVENQEKRYFLMKAEPESRIEAGVDVKFSIDDLQKVESEPWDGVRNAEASKTMRERMKIGDLAFFYHSNTKQPGIAGIAQIVREGYPDSSAWEKGHPYYDAKTNAEKPKWFRVDVKYVRHMKRFLSLYELKTSGHDALQNMQLLRRPQLSVQRVTPEEWHCIMEMEQIEPDTAADDEETALKPEKKKKQVKIKKNETEMNRIEAVDDEKVKAEIRDTHGGQ